MSELILFQWKGRLCITLQTHTELSLIRVMIWCRGWEETVNIKSKWLGFQPRWSDWCWTALPLETNIKLDENIWGYSLQALDDRQFRTVILWETEYMRWALHQLDFWTITQGGKVLAQHGSQPNQQRWKSEFGTAEADRICRSEPWREVSCIEGNLLGDFLGGRGTELRAELPISRARFY